jgi:hypothetical protein
MLIVSRPTKVLLTLFDSSLIFISFPRRKEEEEEGKTKRLKINF